VEHALRGRGSDAGPRTRRCSPCLRFSVGRSLIDDQGKAAVVERPWSCCLPIPIGRPSCSGGSPQGRPDHSLGHSPCRNTAGQELTGWTTSLTCAARMGLGGTRWTNALRLVIGGRRFESDLGLQTAAQRALSGVAGRAAATAGSFLGLDRRARRRASPASLRWSPSGRSNARRWPCFVGPLRSTSWRTDDSAALRIGRAFARIQNQVATAPPFRQCPKMSCRRESDCQVLCESVAEVDLHRRGQVTGPDQGHQHRHRRGLEAGVGDRRC
jgi:hypothetical protein